jgi:hypothetical protein
MLRHASELLVRAANLAEAEGRDLRRAVGRLGIGFSFSLVAAMLLLAGSALVLMAIWLAFASTIGPAWASAITGVAALLLGAGALKMSERYHT